MKWKVVSVDKVQPQPWRNRGGLTRELLAWPDAAQWQVRASLADIGQNGPFSPFAGVERWFAVLEGEGVVLRMPGEEHLLMRGDAPLRFDGALPVECGLLRGATRDFNLMAPPGRARMWRVRGRRSFSGAAGTLLGVYGHEEPAQLTVAGRHAEIPARHFAWTQLPLAVSGMVASDHALWMEVSP